MSVRAISRKSGRVMWEVRWRDSGRNRSRVFDRKRDAENFDLEVRRRAQIGELDLVQAGRETPAEFAQEWWGHHAVTLEEKTQLVYADLWDRHVLPRIGQLPLRRITPELVEKYMSELRAAGVPDPTIRKTLALIQTVLQRAVVWRRISSNPVAAVKKPSQSRRVAISPPSPARVEAMRADLLARSRIADATLVCILAYAGLRPGEALALRWSDIRERTILVERAVSLGRVKATKTRRIRAVRILAALAEDIARLRSVAGDPLPEQLLFPRRDGTPMKDDDYRNWKNRVYNPAARRAGLASVRPYDLRHAFVSLMLAEGRSVVDVAAQAGHAPTMTLDTYAHVMADLDGADDRSADAAIAAARDSAVRVSYARVHEKEMSDESFYVKAPRLRGFHEEPSCGLEPQTPSLPWRRGGARKTTRDQERPAFCGFRRRRVDLALTCVLGIVLNRS